jgi:hypothetical protein
MSNFPDLMVRVQQTQVDFLETEISAGNTFADLALSARDDLKRKRNTQNACIAYQTLQRFIGSVSMTPEKERLFLQEIDHLKQKLARLGESV